MENLEITRSTDDDGGEYRARLPGCDEIGRLTYKNRDGDVRVADHTLVPAPIRGRGVAARLVERLVEDARTEGVRIVPQCSYVDAAFRSHGEWSDLRA